MSNVHYLDVPYRQPLNSDHITDELIDILFDLLPERFSYWSLKLAQSKFNERQRAGHCTWLDKLQVYVGLPTWVVSEEQMLSEALPHLKCPFGLLQDLNSLTFIPLQCAVPYAKTDSLTGRSYDAYLHTKALDIDAYAYLMDCQIDGRTGDFEHLPDLYDRLISNELQHVCEKKEFLVTKLRNSQNIEAHLDVTRTSLLTCKQLADGEEQVIKSFLGLKAVTPKSIAEAKRIYSKLDIDEFFEWASQHFGLDDYYFDGEDFLQQMKGHLARSDIALDEDGDEYRFFARMVGRTCISADLAPC